MKKDPAFNIMLDRRNVTHLGYIVWNGANYEIYVYYSKHFQN